MQLRDRRAFTLVETLVVMAIVAILSAFAFGVLSSVQRQTFVAATGAELLTLKNAVAAYRDAQGHYPARGHADDEDPGVDGRLFRALYRTRANPQGTLSSWDPEQLCVREGDGYRRATALDVETPGVVVVLCDRNLRPIHYRECESRATPVSRFQQFVVWSEGWNRMDDGGRGDDLLAGH